MARALWILAACAAVAALRFWRDLLIPLVLGVLLALMLSGLVETLRRYRVPRGLSALVLLAVLSVAVAGIFDAIATPAQQWIESAPRVLRTIERRMRPAQSVMRRIDAIAERASALASPGKSIQPPAAAPPASSLSALAVLAGTGWVVGAVGVGLALTLLLLAAGPEALARMTAAFAADWHAVQVLRVIDSIRLEVGRYYGTLALINIGFGLVTALTMGLLGMPNPMLWGALAGVLNFVPYLGCATTFAVLTVVSLVTFDQLTHTLMVSASFLALAAIEGHIIEPIFIGRRLDLNPIVVLVALWVGGWMWGIAGMVFALPALVAAKVAAAHSSRGRRLVRLLSPRRRRAHRRWQRGRRIAPRIARDPTAS